MSAIVRRFWYLENGSPSSLNLAPGLPGPHRLVGESDDHIFKVGETEVSTNRGMFYTGRSGQHDLAFETRGGVRFLFSDNGDLTGTPYPAIDRVDFVSGHIITPQRPIARQSFQEIDLGPVDNTTSIVQLGPQSAVKLDGYTTENNYIQPFQLYAWRAYDFQPAGMHVMQIPQIHEHSNAVDWQITTDGLLQIRKLSFDTYRGLRIARAELLRGASAILYFNP